MNPLSSNRLCDHPEGLFDHLELEISSKRLRDSLGVTPIGAASSNSVDSDVGRTSRVNFDKVALKSQKTMPTQLQV